MSAVTGFRNFAELTSFEVAMLPREKTVFFICTGSLVDKGPHLPMNATLLCARALAESTGRVILEQLPDHQIVFLPDLPLAVSSAASSLFLGVRGHVLRDALVDQCEALSRSGFRWFVCFSEERSPRQLTAIEEAGAFLWSRNAGWKGWLGRWTESLPVVGGRGVNLISACSALIDRAELWRAPLWPDPLENGGMNETSRLLAAVPHAVRAEFASLPAVAREESRWRRFSSWYKNSARGYWGEPARANADAGRKSLDTDARTIAVKLRAVLEGAAGHLVFRSGFKAFPTNHTLFSVWLMGAALGAILITWVIFSVRWMIEGGV
jgi:creatinine amidohydrolase/Fe(II)-dependent formamide hydrolase-like protein